MSRGIALEFAIQFGVEFAIHFAIDFAPHLPPILPHNRHKLTKAPYPRETVPKMTSSNTLPAKIAAILTLRIVCAHESS